MSYLIKSIRTITRIPPIIWRSNPSPSLCNYTRVQQCSSALTNNKSKTTATPEPVAKSKELFPQSYGQPTPKTHPHIVNAGEIIPGITINEFKQRREMLMEKIQRDSISLAKKVPNHIVIIPSASKKYMSDKIPYVFRQNTDFLYLSGCLEMDSCLVIWSENAKTIKSALFMRPKDKHAELWDGPRTGVENAPEFFGVDEAYPDTDLSKFLMQHFQKNYLLWYDSVVSDQPKVSHAINLYLKSINQPNAESPMINIHRLRLIKSAAEIQLMRQTCRIASKAINKTIRKSKPGDTEHHMFARVDYYCRMNDANYLAYPPVVASGRNATTIHYINNTQVSNAGELVLMDAGCEYGGYTSDITRTWPINGEFSTVQRILYEVILTVQKELIDTLLNDGGQTLNALFDTMCIKLGRYLQEIGLVSKSANGLELARAAYSFCPHHVSHYLGMDVHDTPLITRTIPLVPGMICTVEPGIYIDANRDDVPKEFRGIGIRIEDDVLIADNDTVEVLTENCIKEPDALEKLIKSK